MYLELCSVNQTTTLVTLVPSCILQKDRHTIIIIPQLLKIREQNSSKW